MLRVAALCLALTAAAGQTFEVASIKPSGPNSVRGSDGGPGSHSPERYTFGQATILDLVTNGYNVEPFQVSSKTALDRDRFDLAATLPPGATRDQLRAMIRNVLAERFHLKIHVESREFSAYALEIAKSGAKLKPASPDTPLPPEPFPQLPSGKPGMTAANVSADGYLITRVTARQMSLSILTRMLRQPGEPPIVDRTGLTGAYDFTLEFARETPKANPEAPPAPILATAIQQQLGLQLVGRKLAFDVVVVDSVDRLPTEN